MNEINPINAFCWPNRNDMQGARCKMLGNECEKNPLVVKDLVILENLLKVNTGTKIFICFKDSRMVGEFILTRELVLPKYDLRSTGHTSAIFCVI